MISFIAKYFSSLVSLITAPIRAVWRFIEKIFPKRDFTIMTVKNGNVTTFQQTTFWRFTKFCIMLTMFFWVSWSTYIYIYQQPLLQKRTQQIELMKTKHERQISDLKKYLAKYNELTHLLNITDDKILNSDNLSIKDKETLMNTRSKTWGELDFLHNRISEMMADENYTPEFDKLSELTLQFELVKNDNETLTKQHADIINNVQNMIESDEQIINIVSTLTSEKNTELGIFLEKIKSDLTKLGISKDKLLNQANNYTNPFMPSKYTPFDVDKNTEPRYKKVAQELEQWSSMSRLSQILPFGAPVKKMRITSDFGTRKDPFTNQTKKHKGIDFAGKVGTELYTVAPGRVISVGERAGYGKTVEVEHGLGFTTLYAHLSKILVSRGDWIKQNTVVGLAGSSGRSTGPHLHYEIRYKGTPFNPINFIKE
ncbi:MAG: M23 family metallopeptidase [Alphaproteobacteria bacterium]|nr:M23 family metallopeptidase [Alphaproteobacteria bacterium]